MAIDDYLSGKEKAVAVTMDGNELKGLEEAIENGGFVFGEEGEKEEYGASGKVEKARGFLNEYKRFMASEEGKKLVEKYGNAKFDGYGALDLGEKAIAAVIKMSDKNTSETRQYLTVNTRYADRLDEFSRMYVMAHEHMHGAGEDSEYKVEKGLRKYFSSMYEEAKDKIGDAKYWLSQKGSYLADACRNNAGAIAESYRNFSETAQQRQKYSY